MHQSLVDLLGITRDAEQTLLIIDAVYSTDNPAHTTPDDAAEVRTLSEREIELARLVIFDFTNIHNVFGYDAVVWMLGVDTRGPGPIATDQPSTDQELVPPHAQPLLPDHVCLEEDMIYEGHIGAPGHGVAFSCRICTAQWVKIGSQFHEAEAGAHILSPDDVR